MSGFLNQSYYGTHTYGSTVYNYSYVPVNTNTSYYGLGQWNFYTNQYIYLGSVYANVNNNIVNRFTFTNDQFGSKSFELKLTEQPSFPVQSNTLIQFGYENDIYFTGYISEYPTPGESQNGLYVYKGFGSIRYLDNTVFSGIKLGSITRVDKSGTDGIYRISDASLSFNPQVNGYLVISDASQTNNNGIFKITAVHYIAPEWHVTVNNTSTVNANPEIGLVKIYPPELCGTGDLVSDVIKYVCSSYINEGGTFIKYQSSNIATTTGILTGGVLDFYNKTYYEIFQTLNKFIENVYTLGVDEYGNIFCKAYASTPIDKYFVGFNASEADIKLNLDGVKNYITVNRKKSTGTNQVGSERGFVPSQTSLVQESIGTYGRREWNVDLPGYYSDNVCQNIADRLFTIYSQPRYSIKIPNMDFKKYPIDNYSVVSSYNDNIITLINSCEINSGIYFYGFNPTQSVFPITNPSLYGTHPYGSAVYTGLGSTYSATIQATTQTYVKGSKSILVNVSSGFTTNSWVPFLQFKMPSNTILAKNFIISMYIYANKFNVKFQFERGNVNYTSNYIDLAPITQWNRYDMPMSVTSPQIPEYLTLYCYSLIPSFSFYIDNVVLLQSLNEHINVNLYETTSTLDANSSKVDLSFGQDSNRLDYFLASIVNGQKIQGAYLEI